MYKQRISVLIWLSMCVIMGCGPLSSQAQACDVPVFRYALERWPADQYRAIAIETSPFTRAETKKLARLRKSIQSLGLNLRLQVMSPKAFSKSEYALSHPEPIRANTLMLFYPKSSRLSHPVWQGDISSKAVDQLSDCDMRRKLTNTILAGSSAVFLLLESGDAGKDGAARLLLQTTLDALAGQITLPSTVLAADTEETADDEINQLKSTVPFKIDFTILSLAQPTANGDSAEIFRHCLLGLESDLRELQEEPMVFTIYGRGRALPPLIGKGINARMISQIALFVTGACSCQVKGQNPGTDLLIQQDWDAAIMKKEIE
jgi:hypothetical protein